LSAAPQPLAEMAAAVGTEIGVSAWLAVGQDRIDLFAEATGDRSPVHLDPEEARAAGFDDTFAQGFLTLSLLMRLHEDVVPAPEGMRSGFNYGLDRVRFPAPVMRGARVRGRFTLLALEQVRPGAWRRTLDVTIEIEGAVKPALSAEWIGYYLT
jgi:acyl dehydratase